MTWVQTEAVCIRSTSLGILGSLLHHWEPWDPEQVTQPEVTVTPEAENGTGGCVGNSLTVTSPNVDVSTFTEVSCPPLPAADTPRGQLHVGAGWSSRGPRTVHIG